MRPDILLFKEPISAVAPEFVGEMQIARHSLAAKGMTMPIVTHGIRFAREVSNRVIFLRDSLVEVEGRRDAMFNQAGSGSPRRFPDIGAQDRT